MINHFLKAAEPGSGPTLDLAPAGVRRRRAAGSWPTSCHGERDEPPMTRFLARQLSTTHWFNIDAARRDLGYEPRVSIAEGLRRLEQWLQSDQVV